LPNLVIEILELNWKHPRERKMGKLSRYRTRWLGFFLTPSFIPPSLPDRWIYTKTSKVFWDFVFLVSPFQSHFSTSFFFLETMADVHADTKISWPETRHASNTSIAYGVSKTQNPRRGKKIEKIRDNKNLNFSSCLSTGAKRIEWIDRGRTAKKRREKTEMECV
jgi:hypothetical protein